MPLHGGDCDFLRNRLETWAQIPTELGADLAVYVFETMQETGCYR